MSLERNSRREPEAGPLLIDDPKGFSAQYRDAYHRLTLVAAGVTGERESAEDIVQEAAIIAFGKVDQFTPGTNFSAWLAEIVRRCALNHRRKTQQRRTFPTDPAALGQLNHRAASEASPIAASGEVLADQQSFDDELARALQTLGEEARCCLLLRVVEKLTYAEISALLKIPEGTAMSHVHRSKAALRRQLSREESRVRASEAGSRDACGKDAGASPGLQQV
jgi:RNA polymerase sigma-70 factor (ECF subfamily)